MSDLEIKALDSQRTTEVVTTPRLPFSMYVSAGKGSGKTSLILNMLLNKNLLNKKFHKIIWISPTAALDEKISKNLDNVKVTIPNTDLIRLIKKMKEKQILDNNLGPIPDIKELYQNIEFVDTLKISTLEEVIEENKAITKRFSKKYANKTLIIFDDSIQQSSVFKSEAMRKLIFLSRHYSISVIITSQNFFQLPKPLRLNSTYILVYETGSRKEMDSIHQENHGGLSFNGFYKMYSDIVDVPFSFLLINYANRKEFRFQNCFKEFVDYTKYKDIK